MACVWRQGQFWTPHDSLQGKSKNWKYQTYIKDYLRCVAGVDRAVGRVLDYLEETGLDENTLVVYTSDQGFYLGEHGWFDKRWMYEESFKMPFVIQYPGFIEPGTTSDHMVMNIDFGPTLLDLAALISHNQCRARVSSLRLRRALRLDATLCTTTTTNIPFGTKCSHIMASSQVLTN